MYFLKMVHVLHCAVLLAVTATTQATNANIEVDVTSGDLLISPIEGRCTSNNYVLSFFFFPYPFFKKMVAGQETYSWTGIAAESTLVGPTLMPGILRQQTTAHKQSRD